MQIYKQKKKDLRYDGRTKNLSGGSPMKKILASLILLAGLSIPVRAADIVLYSSSVVNRVLAPSSNTDLDLNFNHVDALSVQINYSSANASTVSFTDGNTSTMSILLASLTGLNTAYATNNITVSSFTFLRDNPSYLSVNAGTVSYLLRGGLDYTVTGSSNAIARSIQSKLNSIFSGLIISTVATGKGVIFSTAANYGSGGNAISIFSSSNAALTVNSATFVGGQDAAFFTIGGKKFTANQEWFVGTTTLTTSVNIKNALRASTLSTVVNFSTPNAQAALITGTSTVVGAWTNFAMISSTPTALTLSGPNFARGADSDIIYGNFNNQNQSFAYFGAGIVYPLQNTSTLNTILKTQTQWGTALPVRVAVVSGTLPLPLVAVTTYYASNLTTAGFGLSDTSTGAVAGLLLTLSTSSLTGAGSFTMTPIALSGTPAFKLQMSNDGTNFSDVFVSTSALLAPFTTNVSFASPYTTASVLYNIGNVYYRFLRFAYTAATFGATNINYIVNGRRFAN